MVQNERAYFLGNIPSGMARSSIVHANKPSISRFARISNNNDINSPHTPESRSLLI